MTIILNSHKSIINNLFKQRASKLFTTIYHNLLWMKPLMQKHLVKVDPWVIINLEFREHSSWYRPLDAEIDP